MTNVGDTMRGRVCQLMQNVQRHSPTFIVDLDSRMLFSVVPG